jgi:Leucine-rich repeat (LRR) protein
MKIILLVGFLSLMLAQNILAEQKTMTCKIYEHLACRFYEVTIGPNDAVLVKTDPGNFDPNRITWVQFTRSSIHAVPREVFEKFPNLKDIYVDGQQIQEIRPNTFLNARKLTFLSLEFNALTSLAAETFKGKFSISYQFF